MTLSPRSRTKNLATGDIHSYAGDIRYLYTEQVIFHSYTNLVIFLVACFISLIPQSRVLVKNPCVTQHGKFLPLEANSYIRLISLGSEMLLLWLIFII